MERNKRSADYWPTSKKPCPDHVNMLRPGKDPNQFMVACLLDASKDIMKHVTKEAERIKEFYALDLKRKEVVLKNVSDMIYTRCNNIMLNKIVCGEKHTAMLYFKTYPKGRGLDEEIMRILMDTQSSPDKRELKSSTSNCPTSESSSDKIESKGNTSNCPTSESNSDKILSKESTSNCPTSESSSDKIESKGSISNCPTSESSSDKIESKGSTSNCSTLESNKISVPNNIINNPNPINMLRKEPNKRSSEDWPTFESKKTCTDHVNMLRAGKDPNQFMVTCLRDASKDIIKHVTKEAEKVKEFKALDVKQKDLVLKKISDKIFTRCYDVMLNKIVCGEKHTTMLYYKTYPKGSGLDEEIMRILSETPNNSCSDKMESKSSTSNCPTPELSSDKIESKGNTSNCPTFESNSDKILSKGSTSNCPASESSSDKIESKGSTSNCPTPESNSDKIESKGSTSNCPTSETSSDKIESKGSTSNCPTSETSSDKIESKGSTSNCPTSETSSDKIESKGCTNNRPTLDSSSEKIESKGRPSNCPTLESSSDTIESKGCTNNCPILDSSSDKIELKGSTSNCPTSELSSDKIESKGSTSNCPTTESSSDKIELKGSTSNFSTSESNSDKIKSKESTSKCPTLDSSSDKIVSKGSTSNCPTSESNSDKIESKGSTNDCHTLDSSSDKIELKESTSNCSTSESNSDKIESKGSTSNCPTTESNSDKIESKGSTNDCPTPESKSDKIESKGSTSNCPTSESDSDKIETKGSTSNCPMSESNSDNIESKESTSNCSTSESNSDKIESKGSTSNYPTPESNSDKIESKGSTSNCPTSESSSDTIESKGSTNDCPTSDSNKIWISNYIHGNPNPLNMLTPETNLNSFELTCLQESVTDIMKHINQEAVKMNEFNTLDVKQKHVVLKKVSDVIFTRCKNFKKNKVIDSYARILKIYFTKFPKYKGLDEQIQKMLTEVPNHPSLYEFVDFGVLPQAEQINKIFCDKIDTSVEECFKKMITNIKNYEDEKDIFQCIDELPSIEDIDNESDKLDKSVDSTVGNDIEGLNDLNKVKSHESTVKCDTEVLTDLNKVIDDYEPERKKLKEYYKIIDWFLVPKIEDLLESYKTEFREILKNDKEYVLEATKITCQLWDEFDKPIKVKQRRRQKRRCLIECKLEANENDDDDKEINSENDDMGEEMNSENVDMVEEMNSQNHDMVEEMNSENDDMVEEMNSQNDDMVEEMNSENDMVEEINSQNRDMVEEINSQNDDMVEEMNSQNVNMVEEMNAQNVDMVEQMNSQNDDMVEQMNSENNDDIMDEKENSENKDNKGYDNDRNEDEKERERNSLLHLNSNVRTQPDPVYRVKLISMPDLPSKELILQFLNQFNTKAIKKHKTLQNLLVIDLNTENDYNNILKASGTKIGPHKLLIRSNETNDSDIKEKNENVNTQTVENNSGNITEIVQVFNQGGDKISDERDRNSVVGKHVIKQVPNDKRDKNSEISDKVIKQEPNDELTDVRPIKAEKEADGEKVDEKIENREINSEIASVCTSQEVDIDNSQFVAKLCATPVLPEKEAIAYFIKKYNPTAIKKHKKFDNILLVTFNNKNDYEKFLSMDGHPITADCSTEIQITLTAIKEDLCSNHDYEKSLKSTEDHPADICLKGSEVKEEFASTSDAGSVTTVAKRPADICFKGFEVKEEFASTSDAGSVATVAKRPADICLKGSEVKEEFDSTSDAGSVTTVAKRKRIQLSGAAKRRISWWMARGKSFEEAKKLCKKPLQEFPEYSDEIQARFLPHRRSTKCSSFRGSTEIQKDFEIISKPTEAVEDYLSSAEAKGFEGLEGILEDVVSTSEAGSDRTAATRKRKQLSGAAKRRISWWMARGKSFEEAKELSKKPLLEFQEFIDEKEAFSKLKAATSTTESKLACIALPNKGLPIVEPVSNLAFTEIAKLTTGQVAKPAIEQVTKLTTGQIARPAFGHVPKPTIGQVVTPALGEMTKPIMGPVTQPTTGQAIRPTGQVPKLTTGQVCNPASGVKKHIELRALNIGILDDSGPISQERADVLKACILQLIDETPQGQGPKFLRCSRMYGGIIFTCAEEEITRAWLERAVTKLQPWERANLHVVDASELKPRYATALVHDENIEEHQILSLLRKQNVGLHIPSWRIVSRKPYGRGYIYTFSFDASVVATLSERGFKLFLGFDQISLRLLGPKPARSQYK